MSDSEVTLIANLHDKEMIAERTNHKEDRKLNVFRKQEIANEWLTYVWLLSGRYWRQPCSLDSRDACKKGKRL